MSGEDSPTKGNTRKQLAESLQEDERIIQLREDARAITREHKRRIESGFTEEERFYLGLMHDLDKEFPDAFLKGAGKDGEEAWAIIRTPGRLETRVFDNCDWYLTQGGLIGVDTSTFSGRNVNNKWEDYRTKPSGLLEDFRREQKKRDQVDERRWKYLHFVGGRHNDPSPFRRIDLRLADEEARADFGSMLRRAQKWGVGIKVEEARKTADAEKTKIFDDIVAGASNQTE